MSYLPYYNIPTKIEKSNIGLILAYESIHKLLQQTVDVNSVGGLYLGPYEFNFVIKIPQKVMDLSHRFTEPIGFLIEEKSNTQQMISKAIKTSNVNTNFEVVGQPRECNNKFTVISKHHDLNCSQWVSHIPTDHTDCFS